MIGSDLDLLQQYTASKAEDAFAALVNRHLGLVYSAALRQVRSAPIAEEVAQSVFIDLARDAGKLKPDTVLTAWLYQVTRRTAIDMVRKESRRQARERDAVDMTAMNSNASDWTPVEPLLDEAMNALDETDRAAILLRYFENKSLRDVGEVLGTTDDAAQKRVSRAIERLRGFFADHGVSVGSGGLAVVISANAIQAAPAGLAATISTAALAGATLLATATATTAKALAMTTMQKTFTAAALAAAVGAGIYEAHQASRLREQVQTLRQQQAPLLEQARQQAHEQETAARELAALRDENARLNRNTTELLKLRGEVARLRGDARTLHQPNPSNASTEAAVNSWLNRVNQLKQYVEQNPGERIPEFQFLTDREWLVAGDAGLETAGFEKQDDYRRALESLRFQVQTKFGNLVRATLNKYSAANNGRFPNQLSDLQPFCEPAVMDLLLQLYEIRSADILPESILNDTGHAKTDQIITRKQPVNPNSTSCYAIFKDTNAYWQSPP